MNKIDLPKLWRTCTLIFLGLSIIIIKFLLGSSLFWVVPIFLVYLAINILAFNSYFLGMLGNYFYFLGKGDKAQEYYKKALEKKTRNTTAIYNYAAEILKNGNAEEALTLLQRAEKLNTSVMLEKNIILAKSSCYWVLGNIDKAIETLEHLKARFDYVNAHVYTTLGYFYFLKKDYETAMDYSKKALEDIPDHPSALDNIGQIYFAQEKYNEAKEAFEKALEQKPTLVDSLYYMGLISEKENNINKALEYLEKALNSNISSLNTVTKEEIEEKYNTLKNNN